MRLITLCLCLVLSLPAFAVNEAQTQLIKALRKGDDAQVRSLIESGVDLNFEMGLSPLVMVIRQQKPELVEMMLKNGADVDLLESQPANALISAAGTGDLALVKRILAEKPDLNKRGTVNPKRTALMQAAESGHLEVVKTLVAAGAEITVGDYADDQVLAFAAYHNQSDIVSYLVEIGADLNHTSISNRTALDHAERNNSTDAAEVLISLGAKRGNEL